MPVLEETEVLNVLYTGEGTVEEAISLLTHSARRNPKFLLKSISDAVQMKADGMVMVALAVLATNAPVEFISRGSNVHMIVTCLGIYGPEELFEFVEYMRSKEFGRGFGSRPQKWIREIMETWTPSEIQEGFEKHPEEIMGLLKTVHPRYRDERGELVSSLIANQKRQLLS